MDLDLRQVRYAVTLADELHFGRAAARLTIAQQTLSAQIAVLEKHLGRPLFTRDRRRVALTLAGEVLVQRGRRLLAEAQRLIEDLGPAERPLRIDVLTEGLTPSVLTRHLQAQTPHLPFEVVQSQGLAAAVPRLLAGDLDLAFGRVHGLGQDLPAALAAVPVHLEPASVVLPTDHPLASREEVPLAALAEHPLLVYTADEATEWRDWIDRAVTAFGLQVALRARGHGRADIHATVAARGYPTFGLPTGRLPAGLTARPLTDPVPLFPWHAVWNTATAATTDRALGLVRGYARERHWHRLPSGTWWLPEPDRVALRPTG